MKLISIKTEDEFYEMADIQYQRTKALAECWMDKTKLDAYRGKAFVLWFVMYIRMKTIIQVTTELTMQRASKICTKNYIKGGVIAKQKR